MLELIVAALIQVTVLTSGSAPAKKVTVSKPTTQTSAPTKVTCIGTSGWDDRN